MVVIGSWSSAFLTVMSPLICAIAAGNTVVVKPSDQAPAQADWINKVIGLLDQECYRCVLGDYAVSQELASLPVGRIVFTGNSEKCRNIA